MRRGVTRAGRLLRGTPWVVWAACLTVAISFVLRFGPNVPFEDEWDLFWQLVGEQDITLQWLFSPMSEHRIPLSRLVWLSVHSMSGYDFRAGMLVNVLLLAALAARWLWATARLRGNLSATDAFLPLLILSLAQYENFLWPMQVLFVLPAVLFGFLATAIAIARSDARRPPTLLGPCLVLLPLCDASGLVLSLPLVAWLLVDSVVRRRWLDRGAWPLLACVTTAAVVDLVFLATLQRSDNLPPYVVAAALPGAAEVLGSSLGPATAPTHRLVATVLLGLISTAAFLLVRSWYRDPTLRLREEGLLACLAAPCLLCVAIGYGRGMLGPGACLLPKYGTLTSPLLACIYVICVIHGGPRRGVAVRSALLAAAILVAPRNAAEALTYGEIRRNAYGALVADVTNGMSLDAIVARNAKAMYHEYTPDAFAWLEGLNRHSIGPFRAHRARLHREDGPVLEEDVLLRPLISNDLEWNEGSARVIGTDPYAVFALDRQRDVVGVRVEFVVRKESQPARARMAAFWALRGSSKNFFTWWERSIDFEAPSSPRPQVHTIMVYDRIDLFRLDLEPFMEEFRLLRLTLLLRPA